MDSFQTCQQAENTSDCIRSNVLFGPKRQFEADAPISDYATHKSQVHALLAEFSKKADWKAFMSNKTNEQSSESLYMALFDQILDSNKIPYTKAGRHSTKDRTLWPNSDDPVCTEWKKMDKGWTIMCNDTKPTRGTLYVLLHTKHQELVAIDGEDIVEQDYNRDAFPHVTASEHRQQVIEHDDNCRQMREGYRSDPNRSYRPHTRANHVFDVRLHFETNAQEQKALVAKAKAKLEKAQKAADRAHRNAEEAPLKAAEALAKALAKAERARRVAEEAPLKAAEARANAEHAQRKFEEADAKAKRARALAAKAWRPSKRRRQDSISTIVNLHT